VEPRRDMALPSLYSQGHMGRPITLEVHSAGVTSLGAAPPTVEGNGLVNLDLDSQISSSSFHYTPWALHSDLVH
jgi:hypothetical protein